MAPTAGPGRSPMFDFRIPPRAWIESIVRFLQDQYAALFDGFSDGVEVVIGALLGLLQATPMLVLVVVLALLATWLAGWRMGLFALVGLLLVENIGLWTPFLQTL